ncbi:MAG: 1-(5-phosphoribosyl)-5-[(5-phosphoribosylamino)methylideneamino]imidazole-4-carboxamide isomerase [bacterium]|nr:1-(5-phosphoribosyl)-5-[(5-phosphoribosylamino)methylideneamino]imidazole-4-carboxamide isomerase [bacterium]
MIVIPAVDIREGRCVRLHQGRAERETVYGDDPAAAALRWQREGAARLHVVDLDGAFAGEPRNLDAVREILSRVSVPVEFGGGVREIGVVRRLFKMGVDRIVLGTAAVRDGELLAAAAAEFGRQVFVGLDSREGRLAVDGWRRITAVGPAQLLDRIEESGAGGVICTDIARDGALSGPNTALLDEILAATALPVVASGGIRSADDVALLGALQGGRLHGVIIGKALYDGALTLREAMRAAGGAGDAREENHPLP